MIRTVVMLAFWGLAALVAALVGFPWTFISGDIRLLYRMFMWGCWWGVWLTGVRVQTVGLDQLDKSRTYVFRFWGRPCAWDRWFQWIAAIAMPASRQCARQRPWCSRAST